MATQLDNMRINFLKNEPTSIVNKINKEINNKIKFNMKEITGKNVIFSSSAHRQPIIEYANSYNFNIEYIKIGYSEAHTYSIKPLSISNNQDGNILEAIDLIENKVKTFLINRIIDVNELKLSMSIQYLVC